MEENTKGKIEEKIVVFSMFFAICIILFCFQHRIVGTAIGLDEMEYFNLGRRLHEYGEFSSRQYNILYPLIISFAFFADKLTKAFDIIKIINILLMASSIVPAYLISKKMIGNRIISYIVAFVVSMLPRCSTTLLILAEPLFYLLSLWCFFTFISFIDKKTTTNIIYLAVTCFLLYLTKQAGLVFIIAVEITLIYDYFNNGKTNLKKYFVSFFANIVPIILMMLFNKIRGESAMGYSYEFEHFGTVSFYPITIIKMFLYQLSDVALMSFFVFFVVFIVLLLHIRKEEKDEQSKYIMLGLWMVGIMLLAALHRAPRDGVILDTSPVTYSRYTCVVVPMIIIVAMKQILEQKINYKWIIVCSSILAIICVFYSPISSAIYSYGFTCSFGLAYMANFVHGFHRIVYVMEEVSLWYTVVLILFFLVLGALCLCKKKCISRCAIIGLAVFSLWTGVETTRFVCGLVSSQNPINEVYRYLIDSNIDGDEFVFDEQLIENFHGLYMYNYMWYGEEEINSEPNTAKYLITTQEYSYEKVFSNIHGYKIYEIE